MIRVYRNLNRGDMFSWQRYERGRGWIVQGYLQDAVLHFCKLHVSVAGHNRAQRTQTRNVHAHIYCERVKTIFTDLSDHILAHATPENQIRYNPLEFDRPSFMVNGQPIVELDHVLLTGGRAFIID
jgi:hypothetical protein